LVLVGEGRRHVRDIGCQGVGGVAVKGMSCSVVAARRVVRGSAWRAASWTSRSGTPASNARVTIVCRRLWGVMCLASLARRASRATIRAASWRSSRPPVSDTSSGPLVRPPSAESIARTVRGANGTSVCWSPLPITRRTRCARSTPRSAISAAHASDTRNPFKVSRQARAWSRAEVASAAARSLTASSRSSPSVCESRATEGRRTWVTGEWGSAPSWTA
jgi:hypothetical protein